MNSARVLLLAGWVGMTGCRPIPDAAMGESAPASGAGGGGGGGDTAPKPAIVPEIGGLKLLGVTSGTALVTTDRQSHHFTKGEARMLKSSKGLVLLKCVEMTTGTASFLINDAKELVHLRPPSTSFKIPVSASR